MALLNRIGGGSGGLRPVGAARDCWSQNTLCRGHFVTLSGRETTLQTSLVTRPGTDLAQMTLQGGGRFSRSPEGDVLWNFSGHSRSQFRAERQDGAGNFSALVLNRSRTAADAADLNGDVLALSGSRALVMEGEDDRFMGFHVVEYSGGTLQRIAYGTCADHPSRANWIVLPGPDEDSFFYLSRDRSFMKGQIAQGGITFTVLDGTGYRNLEQLTHASEDDYNKMYGGRLSDGRLLMCWSRVRQILTSGEEEEYDEDLGLTLYWPYETYTYDLYLTLLDRNGAPLDTLELAQGINGSRSTLFAGALDDILPLADGRALLQVNTENNQTTVGRKSFLVSAQGDKLSVTEAPEVFAKTTHWEIMTRAGAATVLARVTAWGNSGAKVTDTFRPQLEYYRLEGDRMTLLYAADCLGLTQTASYEGSFYWMAEWSAAGPMLVFGGRWSPSRENQSRLLGKWESGYRNGAAGEAYVGLCGADSNEAGVFSLIAPQEA